MEIYLVGGAVRDKLLGLKVSERDYVVVGATEREMLTAGFIKVGKDFPVFLHPKTHAEYALARRERKVSAGYKGFVTDVESVSLKEDLERRDLTINAIAQDKNGNIIDPFNGTKDLAQGILRHVSCAFHEDPVRVLRIARFAARFSVYGFKVAHATHKIMCEMVALREVEHLVAERIWQELTKAFGYQTPSVFFKVLKACGALEIIFPHLKVHEKNSAHNKHKISVEEFAYLDNLTQEKFLIKWGMFTHHMHKEDIIAMCARLKCPRIFKYFALLSARYTLFARHFLKKSSSDISDFFHRSDALRRSERFIDLIRVFNLLGISTKAILLVYEELQNIDTKKIAGIQSASEPAHIKKKIIEQVKKKTIEQAIERLR